MTWQEFLEMMAETTGKNIPNIAGGATVLARFGKLLKVVLCTQAPADVFSTLQQCIHLHHAPDDKAAREGAANLDAFAEMLQRLIPDECAAALLSKLLLRPSLVFADLL